MAAVLGTTLTMKDLAMLSKKLHPIASQWYSLGIQLGLYPGELRIIQQQVASEPVDALNRLLEKWLKRSDPPSTLEAMVNVVGGTVIGNGKLSKELQDECAQADFPSVRSQHPGATATCTTDGSSGVEDPDAPLDDGSHFAITDYLQCLAAERKQLIGLGQVLGLKYSTLKGIDSSSFLEDMIAAWLRKEDDVMKRCPPTWRNLVLALRDKRVRQNGIAARIAEEKVQL